MPHEIDNVSQQIQQSYWGLSQKYPVPGASFRVIPPEHGRSTDQIRILREAVANLDEKLHTQVLLVEALRQAVKNAENVYVTLKGERKRLIDKINHLTPSDTRNPVSLPVETIVHICSYLTEVDFRSVFNVWGEVAYKALPKAYSFETLLRQRPEELGRASHIRVETKMCCGGPPPSGLINALSRPAILGQWKEFVFHETFAHSAANNFYEILRACAPHMSTVKRIELTPGHSYNTHYPHMCLKSSCLGVFQAKSCTHLSIPLVALPCVRDINAGGIRHLGVHINGSRASLEKFSSHFRGFDTRNLLTLAVNASTIIGFDFGGTSAMSQVVAPRLRTISTHVKCTMETSKVFFAFAKCFECPHLEALEIHGVFRCPSRSEPSVFGGKKTRHITRFYGTLTRLSLHLRVLPSADMKSAAFFSTIIKDLQVREDGTIPFPKLTHLAVPYEDPWEEFDLVQCELRELLENREKAGAPISTLELVINDNLTRELNYQQHLQIDRLGLMVKNLLVTSNGHRPGDGSKEA